MPDLSVLIATYNRADLLRACLDSLSAQSEEPAQYEVVVVDDGSTDHTGEMLRSYEAPYKLRFERQHNQGQPAALNRAVSAAHGRFCLFTDDDVLASPNLVAEHLRTQRATGGAVVIGKLELELASRGGLASYLASWWDAHYAALDSGGRAPTYTSCYTGNLSAPLDAVRRAGGLDAETAPTHDIELGFRLVQLGLPVVYAPTASASQLYTKGLRETLRDFERRGTAALALFERHPQMLSDIPLGAFAEGSVRVTSALRLLLALRAPVWPVAFVDRGLTKLPSRDRVYRFLQLYCYWRGVRRVVSDRKLWQSLTNGVLFLLYHAIGERGEASSRYIVPADALARQLAWLRRRGYAPMSVDEYVRHRSSGKPPPAHSVVLTFDDGYGDNFSAASPLLRAEAMSATIFLVSASVGGANEWDADTELAGRRLLTWQEIGDLREAGVGFGAHTRSHASLPSLGLTDAEVEIRGSREELERRLEIPVPHFAYPYGRAGGAIEALVEKCGFASACGIRPGRNTFATPLFALRRCEIDGRMSLFDFAATVWLGRPFRLGLPALRNRRRQDRRA